MRLKNSKPEIPIHRSHVSGTERYIRVWAKRETQREWRQMRDEKRNLFPEIDIQALQDNQKNMFRIPVKPQRHELPFSNAEQQAGGISCHANMKAWERGKRDGEKELKK